MRSAELYQAQWVDVNLDGAQRHILKSNTCVAMDNPLAPIVVDWFRELHTLAGNSAYVLPAHSRSRAARRAMVAETASTRVPRAGPRNRNTHSD